MVITRRDFVRGAAGLAGVAMLPRAVWSQEKPKIRVGSCSIGMSGAKQAGLDGIEVRAGNAADTLEIADPAVRQRYKDQMKETGLVVSSLMMGLLNSDPLATDPRAPKWLEQSIDGAKDLGAKVILVAFFGKGSLGTRGNVKTADVDIVVERLKAAAPRAKDAGVILALENTLPAEENLKILQRIDNDAVRYYYDVGNLTGAGYDVPAEIRLLKDRIAQFHFKDGGSFLGEGKVQFEPIAKAIKEINYQGWIVLECSSPSKDRVADDKRNAEFTRKVLGIA
jgi:sugar phosphate isomerase/epimerase